MLFRPSNDVVVISIPCQAVRAENTGFTAVLQAFLFVTVIVEIMEADLALPVNPVVQRVCDRINFMGIGFSQPTTRNSIVS